MSGEKTNYYYNVPSSIGTRGAWETTGPRRRLSSDDAGKGSDASGLEDDDGAGSTVRDDADVSARMARAESLGMEIISEKTKLPETLRTESFTGNLKTSAGGGSGRFKQSREDKVAYRKRHNVKVHKSPAKEKLEKKRLQKNKARRRTLQRDRKMNDRRFSDNIWSGKDLPSPSSQGVRTHASSSLASMDAASETEEISFDAKKLVLRKRALRSYPDYLASMAQLEHLDLRENELCEFLSPSLISILSPTLVRLKLRSNEIASIPPEVVQLKCLVALDVSDNHLVDIPRELQQMERLERLRLEGNASLPRALQECTTPLDVKTYYDMLDFSQKAFDRHQRVAHLYKLDMQLQANLEDLAIKCAAEDHGYLQHTAAHELGRHRGLSVGIDSNTKLLWDLCPSCREVGAKLLQRMGQYEYCDVVAVFDLATRQAGHKTLNTMREIQAVQNKVKLQAVRPIRFFEDVRSVLNEKCPRVIAFSGHADIVNMHFRMRSGENKRPGADDFISVLRDAPPRLECVFLNGCKTKRLAQQVARELPHLTIICWSTNVEDVAALRFLGGFYDYIGAEMAALHIEERSIDYDAAFDSGVAEFERCRYSDDVKLTRPFDWFQFWYASTQTDVVGVNFAKHVLQMWHETSPQLKQHFVVVAEKHKHGKEHTCRFAKYSIMSADAADREGSCGASRTIEFCRFWVGDPEPFKSGKHSGHRNRDLRKTVKRCLACRPPVQGVPAIVRGAKAPCCKSRKRCYKKLKKVITREAKGYDYGAQRPCEAMMPWD